jgi:hypothetical protein
VPVPTDGAYDVLFTGGGYASLFTTASVLGGRNVKVDYQVFAAQFLAGDYNNDGSVNAADSTVYRNRLAGVGGTTLLYGDNTPGVGPDDYARWKMHFGETASGGASLPGQSAEVPEPTGLSICFFGGLFLACARSRMR